MLPIQVTSTSQDPPVGTWALIFINAVVFLFELSLPDAALEEFFYLFGMVPARYSHPEWAAYVGFPIDDYWPFLTSMFLHGGWMHILGNMWTLWIFGDGVEDRMGTARFIIFYLLCGLAAGLVHFYTNADSTVPTVGASGAIAGVLGAYFVLHPRAHVIVMVPIFFWPFFFDLPAVTYLLFWFFMQLFNGTLSLASAEQVGGVAWWAHVGGFVAGMLGFWLFLKPRVVRQHYDPGEFRFEQSWKQHW